MRGILTGGLLSAFVAFAIAGSASADGVERSGNTFHKAVCGRVVGAVARCHAHVVTDDSGRPLATSAPSGYAPSDLSSAYNVASSGNSSTLVAIVDAYGYPNAESDLAAYRSHYGLPACTKANGCLKIVNQSGQTSPLPSDPRAPRRRQGCRALQDGPGVVRAPPRDRPHTPRSRLPRGGAPP